MKNIIGFQLSYINFQSVSSGHLYIGDVNIMMPTIQAVLYKE